MLGCCPARLMPGVLQALREELHAVDAGVTPTPASAAPNPDGSPVNFDCFESKLDAKPCRLLLLCPSLVQVSGSAVSGS